MNRRDFEIKLGIFVMESLADKTDPDDIVEALRVKLAEEERLQESRIINRRSY